MNSLRILHSLVTNLNSTQEVKKIKFLKKFKKFKDKLKNQNKRIG